MRTPVLAAVIFWIGFLAGIIVARKQQWPEVAQVGILQRVLNETPPGDLPAWYSVRAR